MFELIKRKIKRCDWLLIAIIADTALLSFIILSMIITNIQHMIRIDLNDYPVAVDYGVLTEKQIDVFNDILEAVENNNEVIRIPELSYKEQHEIYTHLVLYYGATHIPILVLWGDGIAELKLESFKELSDQKIIVDARVDEALSTMNEGSDRYKLKQISKYIAKKIKYTKGYKDMINASNGKGVCYGYAMLFYKMATRLGIETYICYGYAIEYHAWNMVVLDGKEFFYDVTWYDSNAYFPIFLHSRNSWFRTYQLDNEYSSDLER